MKTSDLSFLQKLGERPSFAEKWSADISVMVSRDQCHGQQRSVYWSAEICLIVSRVLCGVQQRSDNSQIGANVVRAHARCGCEGGRSGH